MSDDVDALGVEKPDEKWNSVTRRDRCGSASGRAGPGSTGNGRDDLQRRGSARTAAFTVVYRERESRRKLAVFVIDQRHR